MTRKFDAIIIGAGQAGPPLAGRLTAAGMTVAMIERKLFGGTCVNTGCMPTKTLVASAYAAHMARRAADYGVAIGGPIAVDMKRVKARKDEVSRQLAPRRRELARRHGALHGVSRPCPLRRRRIDQRQWRDASRPSASSSMSAAAPACPPCRASTRSSYLTNSTIMDLDSLPGIWSIVGGSYIGLEFAQMYRRFGAEVTVIEKRRAPDRREDEDISAAIKAILEDEGIAFRLDAECISFAPHAGRRCGVRLRAGGPRGGRARMCCWPSAGGRTPTTSASTRPASRPTSAATSPSTTSCGPTCRGIWALGDCNGRGAFTHTAYNDFEIVAANLLDNDRAASATASRPMRSTSIRRSAAPA